jgi:hypothetical protein
MSFNVGPRTISATGGSIKRVGNYRIHTFPSELVTDGLVLNLDAGDPRSYPGSGTSWTDLSGNGNTATGVGTAIMPSYNNANGGSLVFDGTNTRVSVPNSTSTSSFTNQLTVSIVCSSTYPDGGYRCPLMKTTNNFWTDGFGFFQSGGIFYFYINTYNGAQSVSTNISSFGLTDWTATYDGQRIRLYQNGSLVTTGSSFTSNITNSSSSLLIGDGGGTGYQWAGNILAVQMYNRGLSAAEVAQNYDALKVRYTSYTNTFTPTCGGGSGKVEVLCVAGGGGGGGYAGGAGGGAGGLLYNSAFTVSSNTGIGLTVGAGGTGGGSGNDVASNSGSDTSFSSLISIGGGRGGNWDITASSGGSGGGGMSLYIGTLVLGGSGTLGQGNAGGSGLKTAVNAETSGGGGGAGGSGFNGASGIGGTGGLGLSYSISGVSQFYAGGGGGAVYVAGTSSGLGGSGVGGDATGPSGGSGKNGIPNTGSGGGGGGPFGVYGGNGSNGIVIVRYPATDYNVELLVVGGGGGGGFSVGSGGGAGGLLYYSSYPVSAGTKYAITIGSGSTAMTFGSTGVAASNGNNSIFGPLVAYGGGGGTGQSVAYPNGPGGKSGGSGSGGTRNQNTPGQGVTGQGNAGGRGSDTANAYGGGGGGGAGAVGGDGSGTGGGAGGNGLAFSISGISTYYAGGGGGSSNGGPEGAGGLGGGGAGTSGNGTSAVANTGGGGGGGGSVTGGAGGSGIIIIAYQGPQRGVGGTVDTTSRPGYTLHTFTTTGTDFFIP